MTTMKSVEAQPGTWVLAVDNKARAFLQLQSGGYVRVTITTEEPLGPNGAPEGYGIVLGAGEVEELDLSMLEDGDRVYVTSLSGSSEVLAVVHSDAAPS